MKSYDNGGPSRQAKEHGLKSLSQVSKMVTKSTQTLNNWANDNPGLFEIVLLGAKAKMEKLENARSTARKP